MLTVFGVFWGIFLLLLMLASGNGLANGMIREFTGGATNSFYIWSRVTKIPYRGMPSGRVIQLTFDDVKIIGEQIPEVAVVTPFNGLGIFSSINVKRGSKSSGFAVFGVAPEFLAIESLCMTSGRFIDPLDMKDNRKVAVIGERVAKVLFNKGENPINQAIEINGIYCLVVGMFKPFADEFGGERTAQTIFIPFATFGRVFNASNKVSQIPATAREGIPASVAEQKVLALLKRRHIVAPKDEGAFSSYNQEEDYNRLIGLFASIDILIWIVGAGTLTAGAIGVSNIMLIVVKERTKEIGIRRAIGARPVAIIRQILLEAMMLTTSAGYLGLVAGIALIEGANRLLPAIMGNTPAMFRNPDVGVADALEALGILILAGFIAGLIPAMQAIKVKTVVALRAE